MIRETADGYVTLSVIQDGEFLGLCRALEEPELAEDERFSDLTRRARNAGALHEIVNPLTRALSTAELTRRLEAEDVPHAVVNAIETLHEDPQVVFNQLLVESEHPTVGRMRQPRSVAQFEATPATRMRPAPELGQHTDEVFLELGTAASEIAKLREAGVLA